MGNPYLLMEYIYNKKISKTLFNMMNFWRFCVMGCGAVSVWFQETAGNVYYERGLQHQRPAEADCGF